MIGGLAAGSPIAALATPRRARWALVLVHLPMIGFLTGVCWTGLGVYPVGPHRHLDVACALALGAAQLTLSLRVASGRCGPERFVLWALVMAFAITPIANHTDLRWLVAAWFASAAGGMVFAGWARVVAFSMPVLAALVRVGVLSPEADLSYVAYYLGYTLTIFSLGGICLLSATRVVQVAVQLSASRTELADIASRTERRRASRDLHDTLGQRLSAISIKSDLAAALWATRPAASAREITEIATIAAQAWRELDDVAHDQLDIAFAEETTRAVALLRSAGIVTDVADDCPPLPAAADRLLGWAVRETSTNLLRHSTADTCRITIGPGGPGVLFEVINDGAGRPSGRLGGLSGLAERARALDGVVAAGRVGRDSFRVQVAIPVQPQ